MASAAAASTRGRPAGAWQNQLPPDLFESAVYCSLGALQRLLLLALIARADRYGRGHARPSHLRVAALDGLLVTDEETERLLAGLDDLVRGSKFEIRLYSMDRERFFCFPRWLEWQAIDYLPKTSRFPPPPTDDEPPSVPPGHDPDGSADLPTGGGGATGMPTPGAAPAQTAGESEEQRQEPPEPQGGANLPAITVARRSREYREYEEACRDAELDRWLTPMAFETLFLACLETGREWQVIIEAVRETGRGAAGGRAPSPRYGAKIIREMPKGVNTRAQAAFYFEHQNQRKPPDGQQAPRGRQSNVILKRGEAKDESYYDHIYRKFGDEPDDTREVN